MLKVNELGILLKERGYGFASGVPCTFLKSLINYSLKNFQYIMATNEGEAVAISAGAYLAGKKSIVLMQNSGLTNALNPLTSLNYCFEIPVLGFVSWRGEPGLHDEPEHELMGQISGPMLELCKIPFAVLSKNIAEVKKQIEFANDCIENQKPFFFIVKKYTFEQEPLSEYKDIKRHKREIIKGKAENPKPSRLKVLEAISSCKDANTLLLASTGKGGRELFEIKDSAHNLYMVGSMGCVSSMGLGIALIKNDKKIIAIDGDGALLMRMGSLTTNGFYAPNNMMHILLDNNSHDSTGGQQTVSKNVDFTKIACDSGYAKSIETNDVREIGQFIYDWKKNPVLTFMNVGVSRGSKQNLGRPTVKPPQVKERFMRFISGGY
jgi:phosphonopyruvate decarboxylase